MKVDSNVDSDMNTIASRAKELEEIGYSGLRIAELNHDPFMPLAIAASKTDSIELITSVAVAFSRNPMSMATLAHDLNAFSNGTKVKKVRIVVLTTKYMLHGTTIKYTKICNEI